MELKNLFMGIVSTIALGTIGASYADQHYYPPERINCTVASSTKLLCAGFNRSYLIEDLTNAEITNGQAIFNFNTAVAYFTPNQAESTIFFTYRNSDFQIVRLKTVDVTFRPDLRHGSWKKFNDDIYTCDAGYMHCSILKA